MLHAFRGLSRSRGYALTAILMLALGLAAVGVTFAVVRTVLLRPLPFRNADRMVVVANHVPAFGSGPGVCTLAEFELWQRSGLFEAAAALDAVDYTLEGHGRPERIYGASVTPDFFRAFGMEPVLGRAFLRQDATAGHDDVIVLSHQLWARRFQSDPNLIGKSISLSGTRMAVVGVMPAGFEFPRLADVSTIMSWAPEQSEFWVPLTITQKMVQSGNFNYYVLGRLRTGVARERAAAQFRTAALGLFRQAEAREPAYRQAIERMLPLFRVQVTPLGESMAWAIRDVLWMLLAAVGLLLGLLLFNLGNLLLTRNANRLSEYTIRQALGASRWHLFRASFLEQIIIVVTASACGWVLVSWGINVIRATASNRLPRLYELSVDWQIVAVLAGLALFTAIIFGAAPQLILPGLVGSFLHAEGRTATSDRRVSRLRSALMAAEIAVSIVLLVGAGLLLQSFVNVARVNPGFAPHHVLSVTISFDPKRTDTPEKQLQHTRELLARFRAVPGVESASVVNRLPLTGETEIHSIQAVGKPVNRAPDANSAEYRVVDADYFRTMRIPRLEGRFLRPSDPPNFAVINGRMAHLLWPGEDPIGKQIVEGDNPPYTVIGVAGDVHGGSLESEPRMQFYRLITASPGWANTFVIRCAVNPFSLVPQVQNTVWSLDASEPVTHAQTMDRLLSSATLERRLETALVASFAAVAVFLSAIGLFGIVSLAVARRIREIGIRMALGATASGILKLELSRTFVIISTGLASGLVLTLVLARSMTALLYGVSAWNLRIYAAAAVVLTVSAFAAAWFPARRAAKVDPASALRHE
jgi:putative ABC transport system permease protein